MKFSEKFGVIKINSLLALDEVRDKAKAKGKEIIDLSVGTPDFSPAPHIIEAVKNAALNPDTYKYSLGDCDEMLDAVIGWYKRRYGVLLERNNITSVNGSQDGIGHIFFPLLDEGDIVLVPEPGYPVFSFAPTLVGATTYSIPLLEKNKYLIDFDSIDEEIAKKAKAMIVSYPMNPVTAHADYDFYLRLVEFAKKFDIFVIHDSAYSELIYDYDPGSSFLSVPGAMDIGMEFNSLSKTYNLTGLRISFAIGNEEVISRFKALRSQIDYGMNYLSQTAAIAALNGPQDAVEKNRAEYKRRRDCLCQGLNKIGWKVPKCDATMFTWFPIPPNYTSSMKFAVDLIEKAGIICVPGIAFGQLGEGYVRMALIKPVEILEKVIDKIEKCGILIK